jgi:hypothetical protein
MNDLIEAAIETSQSLSDAVGCWRGWCLRRSSSTPFRIAVCHAFELSRQRIETLVDGSEVFADIVVVIRFPVWSALLPHAFLRSLGVSRRNSGFWDARVYGRWQLGAACSLSAESSVITVNRSLTSCPGWQNSLKCGPAGHPYSPFRKPRQKYTRCL